MGAETFGHQLKVWRQRRRLSQLDLALDAGMSARHLSFLETGRSRPSRGAVLRLAEELGLTLRSRNAMLLAAGFSPAYAERSLDDPALEAARRAIELILQGHEPFPALAVDRHWTMVAANAAIGPMIEGVAAHLLEPPVNVLRLSLHPEGLAPRIVNLGQWKAHILDRLEGQVAASGDPDLQALIAELGPYPAPHASAGQEDFGGVLVPLVLEHGGERLSFFSTTTIFGTPAEITLSEIAIEAFFPADAATAQMVSGK